MKLLILLLLVNIVYSQHRHQKVRISSTTTTTATPEPEKLICKEKYGYFPDEEQCDAYLDCDDWKPTKKYCPDGLRFKPKTPYKAYPCVYPTEHKCAEGLALQKAVPTNLCPHQYGYFSAVDSSDCGKYRSCVAGQPFEFHCPEGLAYNEETYQCEWPDLVETCNVEEFLNFTCPGLFIGEGSAFTVNLKHPYDCRKYYMCMQGKPRLLSCGVDEAFDEYSGVCADAETVDCVIEAE